MIDGRRQGEVVEIKFIHEALCRGLTVSIPSIEVPYDCIVDNGEKLLRVQIKATFKMSSEGRNKPRYKISVAHGANKKIPYTSAIVDIIALYVQPLDRWYFFPVEDAAVASVNIYPESEKYSSFRDNWGIFFKKEITESQFSG